MRVKNLEPKKPLPRATDSQTEAVGDGLLPGAPWPFQPLPGSAETWACGRKPGEEGTFLLLLLQDPRPLGSRPHPNLRGHLLHPPLPR